MPNMAAKFTNFPQNDQVLIFGNFKRPYNLNSTYQEAESFRSCYFHFILLISKKSRNSQTLTFGSGPHLAGMPQVRNFDSTRGLEYEDMNPGTNTGMIH